MDIMAENLYIRRIENTLISMAKPGKNDLADISLVTGLDLEEVSKFSLQKSIIHELKENS